jgi:hypothetical protein
MHSHALYQPMKFFMASIKRGQVEIGGKPGLKDPGPFEQRRPYKDKHGLDDDTRKPERSAAGYEIKKGQWRPLVLAEIFQLHVNHPSPEAEGVKEGEEKIEGGERANAEQARPRP